MATRHFFTSRYATLLLSIRLPQAFVAPRFTLVAWDNSLAEVYTELRFTLSWGLHLAEITTSLRFTLSWSLHRAEVYNEAEIYTYTELKFTMKLKFTLTLSWSLHWHSWSLHWAEIIFHQHQTTTIGGVRDGSLTDHSLVATPCVVDTMWGRCRRQDLYTACQWHQDRMDTCTTTCQWQLGHGIPCMPRPTADIDQPPDLW